jgi:hypothetical protein
MDVLKTQSALIASIILAVGCTMIEAVLAHTFSETIDSRTSTPEVLLEAVHVADGRLGTTWGGRKTISASVHNTAYAMIQSVHADQAHQTTARKQNTWKRLDTANFLQGLHSHK